MSFQCIMLLAFFLLAVNATQVMQRPDGYRDPARIFPKEMDAPVRTLYKRNSGKVQAAYFTNWGIYGANFQPTNINPSPLTHILYSFADVSPDTGAISLTDLYADEQKHYPGDSWSEPGINLYGCLKQLYMLKLAHRNLKVILSVGGWTYSQSGHFNFVTNPASRATFMASAARLVEDYGFDGIDIDFEYPSNTALGQGFASLVTDLRMAFDQLASKKGDATPYQISAAVSAGAPNYVHLEVPQMDSALTWWNLMAYDYAGAWLNFTDNQANVYGGSRTNVSTDAAVKWFVANGATSSKINMGIPLYGRAFENTNGLGQSYSGVGPGTIAPGIYSYKTLPLAGAQVFENLTDATSYSYDFTKKEFVSYDTPDIAIIKAEYVATNGLAGSLFWELSTDAVGSASLVDTTASVYGSLDQTLNHINYSSSKWDNIRYNMGQSTRGSAKSAPPPPYASITTSSSSAPTVTSPSGSKCAGNTDWASLTAYTSGAAVTYNGHSWTAEWQFNPINSNNAL